MLDVIIVGGGPAGLTAGLYAARSGMETLIVEKLFAGGQASTASLVENYPGFPAGISGTELAMEMEKQARKAGASILFSEVKGLELEGEIKSVLIDREQTPCRSVILAMGAQRRLLEIPGEMEFAGRGVSFCGTCDGNFFRSKTVAVVGGGNTAAEDALYLAGITEKVYLIHRRDALRASPLLEQRIRENSKIEILWNTIVKRIKGGDTIEAIDIESVDDGQKRELALEGLFVAVGMAPQTALLDGKLPLENGYVTVGANGTTSIPGVFVAGDIRKKVLRQIVTAAADGAQAAVAAWAHVNAVDDIVRVG